MTGVEEAEDEREEGHTRPTRLLRRSRHVNGLGRRRSGGEAGSGIDVGAGGVEVGLEVERRIAGENAVVETGGWRGEREREREVCDVAVNT